MFADCRNRSSVLLWPGGGYSVEAWVDLCAKQLAMRLVELPEAQCLAYAKNLHTNGSQLSPIEAANLFSQLYRDVQDASLKSSD